MEVTKKIVAIGGGEMKDLTTLAIDREIVRLTNKEHPHALFIPTASDDSDEYWQKFRAVYGEQLGCTADVLWLLKERPTSRQIEDKIFAADLIYVGGGNTLRMMNRWRQLGVDRLLREAYERGIVLSGLSAGAICWFRYGHSDSRSFSNPARWNFIRVKGLGLIHAIACPHYHSEKREESFEKMVGLHGGVGIALDDNCALEVVDDQYRIITSQESGRAYRLYKKRGKVVTEPIEQEKDFRPISTLLERQ